MTQQQKIEKIISSLLAHDASDEEGRKLARIVSKLAHLEHGVMGRWRTIIRPVFARVLPLPEMFSTKTIRNPIYPGSENVELYFYDTAFAMIIDGTICKVYKHIETVWKDTLLSDYWNLSPWSYLVDPSSPRHINACFSMFKFGNIDIRGGKDSFYEIFKKKFVPVYDKLITALKCGKDTVRTRQCLARIIKFALLMPKINVGDVVVLEVDRADTVQLSVMENGHMMELISMKFSKCPLIVYDVTLEKDFNELFFRPGYPGMTLSLDGMCAVGGEFDDELVSNSIIIDDPHHPHLMYLGVHIPLYTVVAVVSAEGVEEFGFIKSTTSKTPLTWHNEKTNEMFVIKCGSMYADLMKNELKLMDRLSGLKRVPRIIATIDSGDLYIPHENGVSGFILGREVGLVKLSEMLHRVDERKRILILRDILSFLIEAGERRVFLENIKSSNILVAESRLCAGEENNIITMDTFTRVRDINCTLSVLSLIEGERATSFINLITDMGKEPNKFFEDLMAEINTNTMSLPKIRERLSITEKREFKTVN